MCGFTYAAVLEGTYHLAGVKDGSYKLNPILRCVMIVASLSVLGLSAAIVIPPMIYLEKAYCKTALLQQLVNLAFLVSYLY